MGDPQNGWFIREHPIKWVIREYPHFRKCPTVAWRKCSPASTACVLMVLVASGSSWKPLSFTGVRNGAAKIRRKNTVVPFNDGTIKEQEGTTSPSCLFKMQRWSFQKQGELSWALVTTTAQEDLVYCFLLEVGWNWQTAKVGKGNDIIETTVPSNESNNHTLCFFLEPTW